MRSSKKEMNKKLPTKKNASIKCGAMDLISGEEAGRQTGRLKQAKKMQKNYDYYTTSAQYYGKDNISDDEYFLMPHMVSQVPHVSAKAPAAHYGLKSDSMYGSDKYEDHQQKDFHIMNRHQNKGHHGVPEVNKKVHFAEHVEFDKNGKHEVYDEEISVDVEADGFIQKHHQTFDKWETFKRN